MYTQLAQNVIKSLRNYKRSSHNVTRRLFCGLLAMLSVPIWAGIAQSV